MLCDRMTLNVWEVVAAAATKPYGFMPFQPGPGLGGHCLPIDPFYLAWKARELDFPTEFIELAGKVNQHMPYYCAERVAKALNGHRKPVAGSSILVLGVAYKGNVGDLRESPALKLIGLLHEQGADVSYHDPFVPSLTEGELHLESRPLTDELLARLRHRLRRHRPLDRRLRPGGRRGAARDRLPKRGPGRRHGGAAVSDRITVGMVGLGGWGKNLLRNFGTLPEADLRWCCDADEATRDALRGGLPGRALHAQLRRPSGRPRTARGRAGHARCRRTSSSPGGRSSPARTSWSRSR